MEDATERFDKIEREERLNRFGEEWLGLPSEMNNTEDGGAITETGPHTPLYVITSVFGAAFILLPIIIRKGPNRWIVRCSIMLAVFSMWLLAATVYIAQMHPLLGPRLSNETLAWLEYTWAQKSFAKEPVPGEEPAPAPAGSDSEEALRSGDLVSKTLPAILKHPKIG